MIAQLDLFDADPPARRSDTSEAAARKLKPSAARLRRLVLDAFRGAGPGGLTADEVAARLRLSVLAVRPRVSELRKAGMIADAGARRPNRSGRSAMVLRITEAGR